jgi:hypothetical protein
MFRGSIHCSAKKSTRHQHRSRRPVFCLSMTGSRSAVLRASPCFFVPVLHFQNACAAVNKRDRAFDALIHSPSGIAADQLAQAFQKELVEKLYKAMPGTILHLEHVYRLLVQELVERYPKETAYGPIAQTNPATSPPR